jgi:hypothetical protein
MINVLNSPIVLIMIFVISLFVGNHIYRMGLNRGMERGRIEGIETGKLQTLQENMIRNDFIELRRDEIFMSVINKPLNGRGYIHVRTCNSTDPGLDHKSIEGR